MPGSHTEGGREHPRGDRHHGDEPQLAERAFRRLAAQFRGERLLGAPPFGLDLRALEIHAGPIAVERLLQRRDDDAGEVRFEPPGALFRV